MVSLPDLPTPAQELVVQSLSEFGRLAWYQTCTAGRDQVLQHAPMATVHFTSAKPIQQQLSRLARNSSIRGAQPTQLRMTGSDPLLTQHTITVLDGLSTITHHITALDCGRAEVSAPLLESAARALPQLQQLTLQSLQHPLPATLPALPYLTHLTINDYRDADLPFVRHYIKQLHSLHLGKAQTQHSTQGAGSVMAPLSCTPLPKLTALCIVYAHLGRACVDWLLKNVPNLTELTVAAVGEDVATMTSGCSQSSITKRVWQVQKVVLHKEAYRFRAWTTHLRSLTGLPEPAGGVMTVVVPSKLNFFSGIVDAELLAAPLSRMRIVDRWDQGISLDVSFSFDRDLPQAIPTILAVQAPPSIISLPTGLQLTPDALAALAQLNSIPTCLFLTAEWRIPAGTPLDTLPVVQGLHCLGLLKHNTYGRYRDLDDEALTALLHVAPNLHSLTVAGVSLTADHHHHTWPLDSLSLQYDDEVDPDEVPVFQLSAAARLPRTTDRRMTVCHLKVVSCEAMNPQEVSRAVEAMQHCELLCDNYVRLEPVAGLLQDTHSAALGSALSILQHAECFTSASPWRAACKDQEQEEEDREGYLCEWSPHVGGQSRIGLSAWTYTPAVVEALAKLPPWRALDFRSGVWACSPEQCRGLLSLLPTSYTGLHLGPLEGLSEEHVAAICAGAPAGCRVVKRWCGHGWIDIHRE